MILFLKSERRGKPLLLPKYIILLLYYENSGQYYLRRIDVVGYALA